MKAILVNSLSSGGGEKVALEIYRKLQCTEDVKIILLEEKLDYLDGNKIESERIIILEKKFGKFFGLFYYAYQLSHTIRKYKINYIQSHLYRSNFVNVLCKILFSFNFYCQVVNHGDPYRYRLTSFNGLINRFFIRYLYVKADSVVAISKSMKANLNKMLSGKVDVKVVNNPYHIDGIVDSSSDLDELLLPDKYYVSMGRLISLKRIDFILNSVAILKYNLVIIGDGDEMKNLKNLAGKLNVEDKVFFLGRLNNPYSVIKNAIAYIGSSESEGFPNAIIESLALSVPVIHSDCISGPREILSPKSNFKDILSNGFEPAEFGILYSVGDIEALNNSIKYLNDNLSYRENIIDVSFSRASDFDSCNIIEKYFFSK